jgi:hypothetical protein
MRTRELSSGLVHSRNSAPVDVTGCKSGTASTRVFDLACGKEVNLHFCCFCHTKVFKVDRLNVCMGYPTTFMYVGEKKRCIVQKTEGLNYYSRAIERVISRVCCRFFFSFRSFFLNKSLLLNPHGNLWVISSIYDEHQGMQAVFTPQSFPSVVQLTTTTTPTWTYTIDAASNS